MRRNVRHGWRRDDGPRMNMKHRDMVRMKLLRLMLQLMIGIKVRMLSAHRNGEHIWVRDGNPIHVQNNAVLRVASWEVLRHMLVVLVTLRLVLLLLLKAPSLLLRRAVHVLRWQPLVLKLLWLLEMLLGRNERHAHHVVGQREAHLWLLDVDGLIPMRMAKNVKMTVK